MFYKNFTKYFFVFLFVFGFLIANNNFVHAKSLQDRIKEGEEINFLVNVDDHGKCYYVDTNSFESVYLGAPDKALKLIQEEATGVSNLDFDSWNGVAPERFRGKFLLKVDDLGRAVYVSNKDRKMNVLGSPSEMYSFMREKSLYVSDDDFNSLLDGNPYGNIFKMFNEIIDLDSMRSESSMDINLINKAEESNLSIPEKIDVTYKADGFFDKADLKNPKWEQNISIKVSYSGVDINIVLNFKIVDNKLYFKVSDLPYPISSFLGKDFSNKWWFIDLETLEKYSDDFDADLEVDDLAQEELQKELIKWIKDYKIFEIRDEVREEKVDDQLVYYYKLFLNKDNLANFIIEEFDGNDEFSKNILYSEKDREKFYKVVEFFKDAIVESNLQLWINKDNFFLNKSELNLNIDFSQEKLTKYYEDKILDLGNDDLKGIVINFLSKKKYSQFNEKFDVEQIEEAKDFQKDFLDSYSPPFPRVERKNMIDYQDDPQEQDDLQDSEEEDDPFKNTTILEAISKQDIPKIELFVMSHCPYALQMEKALLPVVERFGDEIDFQLRFVNYVMHGEKELDEQSLQYCIQDKQKEKLIPYLKCFVNSSDTEACKTTHELNLSEIDQCLLDLEEKYQIKAKFANKEDYLGTFPSFDLDKEVVEQYNVKGSPAFIINGTTFSANRNSANLFKLICDSFVEKPGVCALNDFSADTPAPGFGGGTTSNQNNNSCN